MPTTLPADAVRGVLDRLRIANLDFARKYPDDSGQRQPVHTVYGGGHLFKADITSRLGVLALAALEEYAPTPWTSLAPSTYQRRSRRKFMPG